MSEDGPRIRVKREWLWLLAVVSRVVAAGALMFGPATDSARELTGWDVNRFQQISDADGRPWVDHAVEYPPGSVVLIKAIDRGDVVGTLRVLVVASLVVDLGLAALLEKLVSRNSGLAYLLLGQAMVPAGLVRFDLWAAGLAALGLIALARGRAGPFGLATGIGAAIKVMPGLLVPVALGARKWVDAAAATVVSAALVGLWVIYGGIDAIDQVLSLRDVTGWHIESLPGNLAALGGDTDQRFEADAWRIGSINDGVVLAGRFLAVAAMAVLGWALSRGPATLDRMALAMLGNISALIVTAPLVSPQFMLWLTPVAAMLWNTPHRTPVWLTAAITVITAVTLGYFTPEGLEHPVAALALLVRNGLLAALIVSCWLSCRPVRTLRHDGTSPRPTGS